MRQWYSRLYDASTGLTYDGINYTAEISPEGTVGSFGIQRCWRLLQLAPADTTAPVITLTGDASVTVEVGGTYTEEGATSDGGETVTTSGTVDVDTPGVYTVIYSASDAAGNADTATRTVTLVAPADNTAPVVSIIRCRFSDGRSWRDIHRCRCNLRWRGNRYSGINSRC